MMPSSSASSLNERYFSTIHFGVWDSKTTRFAVNIIVGNGNNVNVFRVTVIIFMDNIEGFLSDAPDYYSNSIHHFMLTFRGWSVQKLFFMYIFMQPKNAE